MNTVGRVRLNTARDYLGDVLDDREDLTIVSRAYDRWREEIDYLVLRHNYRRDLSDKESKEGKIFAVKCAKRGNDVYAKLRIHKKLSGLYDISSLVKSGEIHASFLTLTCDPSHYGGSRILAWNDLSLKWNKFISRIRKTVPCFEGFFRVYEATKNGFPHIHVLLFWSRPKYLDKELLDSSWGAWTWIEKVKNVNNAIGYLIKYLAKGFMDKEHLLTPAILWLLKKRSYGVSGNLFHLIQHMHNSNPMQKTLSGAADLTENFEVIGIYSQEKLQEMAVLQRSHMHIAGWYIILDFSPEESHGRTHDIAMRSNASGRMKNITPEDQPLDI